LPNRMNEATADVPRPQWGPPFLRLSSWPYRVEMAGATVALLILLFVWRGFVVRDLDIPVTIFWILWPDLLAFIPIGIAMRGSSRWPAWGPFVYNIGHSFVPWLGVFLVWSALTGGIVWPLLGWAGHITADRAFGYYLRARPSATR
jgi:hypothetical protein